MKRILSIVFLVAFSQTSYAQPPIDEAQVFEWWDDGIITPEEANEIFLRLEEGNYDEACLLAEVYAQEPCNWTCDTQLPTPSKPRQKRPKSISTTKQNVPSIIPHGDITWKAQYDSDGHLKTLRKELQIQFYYFKFRLGSQELLSYRRDGFEAHFGEVSTLELHSHLPLDTLWGTALLYPIGKFRLGALLDTSKTFNASLAYHANRQNEIAASFWKFQDAKAIALQARTTLGQISVWYQFGQDCPLVKIQLQSEKSRISWKTTAYIHGDSIPQGLNLSKGIVENWLWASQTVNFHIPEALNTVFSSKIRLLSPVGTDSTSARFKMTMTSGPQTFRPSLAITCIEASENCSTTEWKTAIESAWTHLILKTSAKIRLTDDTKPPKIEFSATYHQSKNAFVKLAVAFPNANPAQSVSVQNEIKLDSDWLGCNLIFTFKKKKGQNFQPKGANIQANLKF